MTSALPQRQSSIPVFSLSTLHNFIGSVRLLRCLSNLDLPFYVHNSNPSWQHTDQHCHSPPPEPSAMMEMFMWPLSSWNTASGTGKLIWKFNLKSYLWPVATIWDSTDIADYNSICASHLFAFRSIHITHTPYWCYVAGDFQFPALLTTASR